jgi:tetratricopeptide (TPR) repeat protein
MLTGPQSDNRAVADAARRRGTELRDAGDLEGATEHFREALRLLPSYAEAHVNLGNIFRQQKRYAEAQAHFAQAAALKPTLWQAHFNLGLVAEEAGHVDEAIRHYEHVLGMCPSYREDSAWPEVQWRLSNLYGSQGCYSEALPLAEEVVAHDPSWLEMHCNVGTALTMLGRNEEALARFSQVIATDPSNARAIHSLGIVHQSMHHWDEARKCYEQVAALDANQQDVQIDMAFLSLLLGDYENGWALHEQALPSIRRSDPAYDAQLFSNRPLPEKYWHGTHLDGGTLLIWSERGFGDTLMMFRYLSQLRECGAAKLIVACEQPLVPIARDLPGVAEVVSKSATDKEVRFDYHCSMLSLPFLCGTHLDTIPNHVPYISIPVAKQAAWQARLAELSGLRVGLVWAGNPRLSKDRLRSLPLEAFAPLFTVSGVSWVSLQKGSPSDQLTAVGWPIHDWMKECRDFQDTGALIENLDLVITVDTSIVHLAGALGRPTWLLNRYESEWRWLVDREDSPWYPSVRIFRQPSVFDWESVIERMAGELATLAGFRH